MTALNKRTALVCAGLAVTVLVATAVQAQGVSFEAARSYTVGSSPRLTGWRN